jgi:hypothetical protein
MPISTSLLPSLRAVVSSLPWKRGSGTCSLRLPRGDFLGDEASESSRLPLLSSLQREGDSVAPLSDCCVDMNASDLDVATATAAATGRASNV